jgi:hypothetical protein
MIVFVANVAATARHVPFGWALILAGLLFGTGTGFPATAQGQSIWEVSPYKVEVWVAFGPRAFGDHERHEQFSSQLQTLAASRVGAVWQLAARPAPARFYADVLREAEIDLEQLKTAEPQLAQADKLILVCVHDDASGSVVTAREVDLATRRWSAVERVAASELSMLRQTLALICEVFVPIVRIDRIEDSRVTVSVRASALERPESSVRRWDVPTQIQVGDALQPVLLMADRNGQIGPEGVKPIEWTVLDAKERQGSQLVCEFQSGFRQPFSTRRNSRIQQLAYRIKPRQDGSTLRLVNRQQPDQPLVGYEVYSRPPEDEQSTELIGRTDWRGELWIERDARQPIQLLFVRNGQQLLGKLPLVPGDQPLLVAPLRDDELRLEAEGFLLGVQENLVDLVARREVLAVRIRREIEAGNLEQAEALLTELRQLDTSDDFARRVQRRKQTLTSGEMHVQQTIDELFAQTRSLLGKYLSQDQVDELARALSAARQSSG